MQMNAKQQSAANHFVDKVRSIDLLRRLLSREQ
jgi:hypothetical protein